MTSTVIGSDSAIDASADPATDDTDTRDDRSEVTDPKDSVKPSAGSDNMSSTAVTDTLRVVFAGEPAAKVTLPETDPRSDPDAADAPEPATDHTTCTSAATRCDNDTVNCAAAPSDTGDAGPDTLTVAVSSSAIDTEASETVNPPAVPVISMVSSPSTTWSWVGVTVKVPEPAAEPASMVTLASDPE